MSPPARASQGWGLVTVVVLALYGLAQNAARNVFYTQKDRIQDELHCSSAEISNTLAGGYLVYASGKLLYGFTTDKIGGKAVFVYCFSCVGLVTMAFVFVRNGTGLMALWLASRFFQPAGYLGQGKLISVWFSHAELARVLAVMTVAHYSFDALTRLGISGLVDAGLGWRALFVVYGAITFSVAMLGLLLLRSAPEDRGMSSPPPNPHSVFADNDDAVDGGDGEQHEPLKPNVWRSFRRLAGSPKFLLICLGAALVGTMREIFETNLSTFLEGAAGAEHSTAVALSAVFPLCGIPGIVISGWLVDKYERRRNGRILVAFAAPLAGLSVALWLLVSRSATGQVDLFAASTISALIGLFCIGPYTLFTGVFPVDCGGRANAGLALGVVDFCGYLGSVIFFFVKGSLPAHSYNTVMLLVAISGIGVFAVSLVFLVYDSADPLDSTRHKITSIQDVAGGAHHGDSDSASGKGSGSSRGQRARLLGGRRGVDDGLADPLLR